jgi:polar amino acid transport system substrate-binding protein
MKNHPSEFHPNQEPEESEMHARRLTGVARAAVLGVALATGLLAGLTSKPADALTIAEIQKKGTLSVGLSDVSPPYATMNDKMEHVGLEVDLANMIAKALGVEMKPVIVTSANRVACLLTQCADILVYGLTITPERATQVWFSTPYAVNASGIIAAKDSPIKALPDLVGKKVGVIRAAFGDPVLTKAAPEGTVIQRYDDMSGLLQAQLSGQVDAIFENSLIPGVLNQMQPGGTFETKLTMTAGYWGIAMLPDQENLRQWLNSFIFSIRMDGQLNDLYEKYMNIPLPDLPSL